MLEAIFNWNTFWILLMTIYVPVCFALIGIVLLQKGKGVGFAGAFGLGAGSEAMFGPRGSVSLPVRITQVLAGTFMVLALVLSLTGGLARRGLAPDTVEAAVEAGTGAAGLQQLEELGLGSAVGGPAPAGLTLIDESGEGEPTAEPVLELEIEAEEVSEDGAAVDTEEVEAVEPEADPAEADTAEVEQPADGS